MIRTSIRPARWLTGSALLAGLLALGAAAPIEPNLISGLQWRMIGPFRGGRVSAVSGVIGKPGTFYIGLPLGGVWKTTSAGTTWYPIFDSVKEASSVGSVQVAPSDPKGTGCTSPSTPARRGSTWGSTKRSRSRRFSSIRRIRTWC
jgi:hypothetical protein